MIKKTLLIILFTAISYVCNAQSLLPNVFNREEIDIIKDIKKNYKSLKYYSRDKIDNSTVLLMYTTSGREVGPMSIALYFKEDKCFRYSYGIEKDKLDVLVEGYVSRPEYKKVEGEDLTWSNPSTGLKIKIKVLDKYIEVTHTKE